MLGQVKVSSWDLRKRKIGVSCPCTSEILTIKAEIVSFWIAGFVEVL
jgi:hypothetical protein